MRKDAVLNTRVNTSVKAKLRAYCIGTRREYVNANYNSVDRISKQQLN